MKYFIIALISMNVLILSGCYPQIVTAPTETIENNIIHTMAAATAFMRLTDIAKMVTSTPEMTLISSPEPATNYPLPKVENTLEPIDAICKKNAQVRSGPSSKSENLGGVIFGHHVNVLARNATGMWFLISFADSSTGLGWVRSSAFTLKGFIDRLPIALEADDNQLIFAPPPLWTVFGTPLPLPTIPTDPAIRSAMVTQTADVRVCPTTSCMIIAYLKVGDQIILTGREGENEWVQFLYPSGMDGKGWVSHVSIEPSANGFGGLPYFDLLGNLITPEPPTSTPDPNISATPTRTPTATPAGPLAEITAVTRVYSLQSSLSQILGSLNPKDKIHITSQSINGLWFEIQYPADTTGRAYISSKFGNLLGDFRYLPFSNSNGTPISNP
jgi:uncharacterized protein YgiM (DUF1202 family)